MPRMLLSGVLFGLLVATSASGAQSETSNPTPAALPQLQVLSSSEDGVRLLFELSDFSTENLPAGDKDRQLVTIPGGGLSGEVGEPAIPTFTRLVAVPEGAEIQVETQVLSEDELADYDLMPMQPEEGNEFAYNPLAYARDSYGDEPRAETGDPAMLRDLRVVPLTLRPVTYNPARRTLRVARSMEIKVDFVGAAPREAVSRPERPVPPSFDRLYRSLVANYDAGSASRVVAPGTYLLICRDNASVIDRLQPLIEWRTREGYPVVLATTSETGTTRDQIKSFIQNAYDTWENPPEYIALAGDVSGSYSIPTWYETVSGYGGEGDHPYTQLDGDDVLADAHIGRLSFEDLNQLELIVQKCVSYESTPYLTDDPGWFRRACVVGDPNGSGWSTVYAGQWLKTKLLEHQYTQVDTVWQNFVSGMQAALNQGDTIFGYRGYYGMSGWSNGHTSTLTNTWKLPYAVIITCGTGSFAGGTALSEGFLRTGTVGAPRGGIGSIGTATLGTHTRFNNCVYYGVFRGLLDEGLSQLGSSLTRGKLELYLNYEATLPQWVTIFSHWNNLMGDPAVDCWTGYPVQMVVDAPETIPVGSNSVQVRVSQFLGRLEGAQVCLWSNETYAVGLTDANGDVELPITATTPGDMLLTVTKHNCRPYLATIPVQGQLVYVGYAGHTVDDDATGTSSGNGDGFVNPGESIELPVGLHNFGIGTTAQDVQVTLTSADPYVTITDAVESYGDIAGGATVWCPDDFDFSVDPGCPNGHVIRFGLEISSQDDGWHSLLDLDVVAADLVAGQTHLYGAGGNGILDPGETVDLSVALQNQGGAPAQAVTAVLISQDPEVSVIQDTATYGSIGVGGTVENVLDPFTISADPSVYEGRIVGFTIATEFSGGMRDSSFVTLTVGNRTSDDPIGPDRHGYYAFDNTDAAYAEVPTYDWVEIDPAYGTIQGEEIVLGDYGDYQDKSRTVSLPFPFKYYGQTYTRATVCSNGWLAFGSTYLVNYRNWTIPGAGGPEAMVAAFWDDLYQTTGSKVYQWYDSPGHRWIVEWSRMRNDAGGSSETFEIILYDPAHHPTSTGDGEILLQYDAVSNIDSVDGYATVGIESPDQTDGLLYTYFNQYPAGAATLQSGRAIRFLPVDLGPVGRLQGLVSNASYGGAPIPGADVTLLENGRELTTGPNGQYSGMVPIGTYTVTASHSGFEPDTVQAVTIEEEEITDLDFSLTDIAGPVITTTTHTSTDDTVGPYSIPVTIVEYSGLPEKAFYYRVNFGSFVEAPLTSQGGNNYLAEIPGQPYTSIVEYYVYARDSVGYETTDPPGAPVNLYSFVVAPSIEVFNDDIESDQGWTVGAPDDDATTGIWVREEPVGTTSSGEQVQPEYDHTPDPGEICYVTGNAAPGEDAGTNDVDGGKTTLYTPVFNLEGFLSASISYWVWYTNDRGNNPSSDFWDVDVTSDGTNWVSLEHTTQSTDAWVQRTFALDEVVPLTAQVQLRFVARDDGGGSLVEAAIDDFILRGLTASVVGVDDAPQARGFGLDPCRPNPFGPVTAISYRLPTAGPTTLEIYDVAGRVVRTLARGALDAGPHETRWDGRNNSGKEVASGIYFMRLEAPGLRQVRQVTLIR